MHAYYARFTERIAALCVPHLPDGMYGCRHGMLQAGRVCVKPRLQVQRDGASSLPVC